jgi:hypothetical protein
MSQPTSEQRLALKTPETAFVHTLQAEFNFAPRVARELLHLAQELLTGGPAATTVRPGQVRLVVARVEAPCGPPLAETDKVEVTLTVDAGAEDAEVKARDGIEGLRQGRILRLLPEALEQGGVLTQEDLARVLQVDVRTIRRDIAGLKAAGHRLPTRGMVQGVGRGQTHKVQIIELWLDREGYDKIARWVHHSPQAIQRYVQTFLRMVSLHEQGLAIESIAFVTNSSLRLVKDYLAVYEAAQGHPPRQAKLAEELTRVAPTARSAVEEKKPGGMN